MNFLQKRKAARQRESQFEKDNLWYFIPHYIRIFILCFLVAVAVFYQTSSYICHDLNGTLSGSAHILPKCILPEKEVYFNINADKHEFYYHLSDLTENIK